MDQESFTCMTCQGKLLEFVILTNRYVLFCFRWNRMLNLHQNGFFKQVGPRLNILLKLPRNSCKGIIYIVILLQVLFRCTPNILPVFDIPSSTLSIIILICNLMLQFVTSVELLKFVTMVLHTSVSI